MSFQFIEVASSVLRLDTLKTILTSPEDLYAIDRYPDGPGKFQGFAGRLGTDDLLNKHCVHTFYFQLPGDIVTDLINSDLAIVTIHSAFEKGFEGVVSFNIADVERYIKTRSGQYVSYGLNCLKFANFLHMHFVTKYKMFIHLEVKDLGNGLRSIS